MEPETVLQLRLAGGQPATLRLAADATVLAVEETWVSSYDLSGRPYALSRGDLTYRRALDGRLLLKGIAPDGRRVRELLDPDGASATLEAVRAEAGRAVEALALQAGPASAEALRRLERITAMEAAALSADAARYAATWRRIGILPPDQYLAVVLELTEGCSWNECRFCSFYEGVPFRVKTPEELTAHAAAVRGFFGDSIALRRTLFLGAANALCVGHDRLLPLLEAANRAFPLAPALPPRERRAWLTAHPGSVTGSYAFVDAWTGHRKGVHEYAQYARLGLQRVYVGLETGDLELLRQLGKPGSPDDAIELVHTLRAAGIAAGVIVLLGAGGEPAFEAHVEHTAAALARMRLGTRDVLYLSELTEVRGMDLARVTGGGALDARRLAEQRNELLARYLRTARNPPRVASYDIREFVY